MKIVINTCSGWFALSEHAQVLLGGEESSVSYEADHNTRTDPKLIEVVERLGTRKASGIVSELIVVEVPDDVEWAIYTCDDGREFVYDRKRVWGLLTPS